MELDLDLLKKNWNTNSDFKTYTKGELFQMTKNRSVSVAKWVFIIGLLEILFWEVLSVFLEYTFPEVEDPFPTLFLDNIIRVLDVFANLLPFAFVAFLLLLNYKIRTEDTAQKLMRTILLMKQTIRWYIRLFLAEIIILAIAVLGFKIYERYTTGYLAGQHSLAEFVGYTTVAAFMVGLMFTPLVLLLRWIYKKLIYGRMLRKLQENYDELRLIEE